MPGIAAAVKYGVVACLIALFAVISLHRSVQAQSAQTMVGATVCTPASSVTVTTPTNDTVVTVPTIAVAGTALQANQVDIYIDDVVDHVVPLAMGQTAFSTTLQLVPGTHTIKVVAIDICGGTDGEASHVVTYTPPPVVPSDGDDVATELPSQEQPGGLSNQPIDTSERPGETEAGSLPLIGAIEFEKFLEWLNINTADSTEGQRLSLWRAIVMGAGVYLVVIGMALTVVKLMISLPILASLAPGVAPAKLRRWVSWGFRILGVLLILGALFL